ncbi:uncharacterized protein LOC129737771 [Uranotaenia lowii]|uniref:uncharacterized protein LOC129737771 n=1 Tax=Uranotaenia lowii TaxID=190385 RepID=UPI00247AE38B|nr:uncharacterized protein LOC129737771 [Uranotaenia lowii]
MYRQILVHPDDTRMQRILWRFSHTDPIRTYELQTVTYGLAPSAFLATRTLQQLAEDEGHTYPRGKNALLKWFYVDDCIGGAESIEDAIELRDELDKLLSKGGFPLRKYTSNKMEVLKDLKSDQIGTQSNFEFSPEETIKTLGITWEPEPDTFRFDYNTTSPEKITKRAILSTIAQLFDPLGLISPVVVRAKILMQDLWLDSSGWDDQVPPSIEKRWENFKIQLPQLSKYRIPRYALLPHSTVELHTFVDASEAAYGACTYARSTDAAGNVRIELLAAKSRVAPLKKVSLPRLELCAAVKGAELYSRIMQSLEFNPSASYFWTDSTVTLQWLKSPPSTWKTFIANRVSEIQNTTHNANWNHVAGSQNPADMVSRGVSVDNFISNQLWKKGPSWLAEPRISWPISETCPSNMPECERRDMIVAVIRTEAPDPLFTTYPVLKTLIRTTAYCIRFFKILQANFHKRVAPDISKRPSLEEMKHAKLALIRWAQREAFGREIGDLKKGSQLPKASQIKALNPFIDSEGTIRVGGRLRHSEQSYEFKHPILLPNFHPLSKLIAQFYHYKLIHGGGQVMLAVIREKYWPINGRRLVRNIVRNCFHCSRANPVPAQQQTGQLPFHRTAPSRPFSIAGVDYAGPLYLKPVHKRAAPQKAYVCLFVCFSTKAVHIELVSDLTTPAFLSALRRFVGRRGPPAHIYSDNGKNFVGAKNELHQIYTMLHSSAESGQIDEFCLQKEIEWHLNPPRAPHFGGLWEAAVKIAKRHLYRQLGASRLSFEDMYSILVEIEAAMNSRPLTPLTEDPNDLTALTPAHFLIGTTMNSVPEVDVSQLPISRLDHYQRMQKLYQSFWYRWRTEYLQELQRDTKVIQPNNEIKPGRLVVIVDDFLPPVKWPLARIVDIKPGVDRLSRVVTLRTAKGYITRPITKICLLPHTENLRRDNSTSNESDNQLIQFQRN